MLPGQPGALREEGVHAYGSEQAVGSARGSPVFGLCT